MSDIDQKLKEMAQLAAFSNRISEIHEKNLKMFPLIFFNGVSSLTIDYDLSRDESTKMHVTYKLNIDEAAENERLDTRFKDLEASVRKLFWKDLLVIVYFNEKKVFESESNG